MLPDDLARFAPRPASEVEWEDLLIRLEIVPRVVRNTMDGADPTEPGLVALLDEVVRREARVGRWLESLAAGAAGTVGAGTPSPVSDEPPCDAEWLSHRFASLRARTFVMVQRRGLEVWGWAGEVEPGSPATVHQLLSWLAEQDGRALLDLRQATRC